MDTADTILMLGGAAAVGFLIYKSTRKTGTGVEAPLVRAVGNPLEGKTVNSNPSDFIVFTVTPAVRQQLTETEVAGLTNMCSSHGGQIGGNTCIMPSRYFAVQGVSFEAAKQQLQAFADVSPPGMLSWQGNTLTINDVGAFRGSLW